MNKKYVVSIFVLLLTVAFLGVIRSSAEDVSAVVNANNQFAFELYSKYKSNEGNIFFSPYSISTALAMTFEGARGKTADEMQSVFHFPKDEALRRNSFQQIYNEINKEDKPYMLKTANALWAQEGYTFLDSYFSLIKQYYGGNATNLDFVNKAEESRLTINNWAEEQTNNKIKDLIPSGSLGPLIRLIITNAVYFKGTWFIQFDKTKTVEKDFKVSPGKKVKAMMMTLTGERAKFPYDETEDLQVLELPYQGQELSMLILLPKEGTMDSLEASLNAQRISELRNSLKNERVNVYLPRFKFETKYFMKETLVGMGMPTAFTLGVDFGGEADFSGMTGSKDLNIDQVIHKAFVEVNEEGTEAAAATAVAVIAAGSLEPRIKIFNADHPFIFVIQESATGNILFLGRVNDPSA
jgi:serpin B